jgi:hypothetical protein
MLRINGVRINGEEDGIEVKGLVQTSDGGGRVKGRQAPPDQ